MEQFVWIIFSVCVYGVSFAFALSVLTDNGQKKFPFGKGWIEWVLFVTTLLVVVVDWMGFYAGAPFLNINPIPNAAQTAQELPESILGLSVTPAEGTTSSERLQSIGDADPPLNTRNAGAISKPTSDTNYFLLSCWLLINIACFCYMFQSACVKDIFEWIASLTFFNFNNVFWHLHYCTPALESSRLHGFHAAVMFVVIGIIGIVVLAAYCTIFKCWGEKKNAPDLFAQRLGVVVLGFGALVYFYCSIFYTHPMLPNEVIIGVLAMIGMLATIFLCYARRRWSVEWQPPELEEGGTPELGCHPSRLTDRASNCLLIIIALVFLFKCSIDNLGGYAYFTKITENNDKGAVTAPRNGVLLADDKESTLTE